MGCRKDNLNLKGNFIPQVLGIDLAGSTKRKTGIAFVKNGSILSKIIYTDEELIQNTKQFKYLYIDAPLSLPLGRESIDKPCAIHFRGCDLLLKERGIRFFPITLGPMRSLTRRGLKLKEILSNQGKKVFEVFPGAFYDLFQVPRKDKEGIIKLYKVLSEKFDLFLPGRSYAQDELDAIACFFMGLLHRLGYAEELSGQDGTILIPKKTL